MSTSPASQQHVVVIGGGAMGSAAAWRLAVNGYRVTLLEQFEPGHVRGASHGSSRIFRHAYLDRRYIDLAARAATLWTQLEEADGTRLLTWTGAVDHGEPAAVQGLAEALGRAGIPYEIISPRAAAQRWPGLKFDTVVLHHAAGGAVDADRAVAALQRRAAAAGAHLVHRSPARRLIIGRRGAQVVLDSGTLKADQVVVATGAWTADLVGDLLLMPTLRTTREQPAHFPPIDANLAWPSFIHHPGSDLRAAGVYGLGSPDGIKIGEHGTGPVVHPDTRTFAPDPVATDRLIDYAAEWLPGVDPTRPDPITCLYTTTPDSNFIIDRVGPITVAAGFSGHGFKFAPAIGDLISSLVTGNIRPPALFALNRFAVVLPARSA